MWRDRCTDGPFDRPGCNPTLPGGFVPPHFCNLSGIFSNKRANYKRKSKQQGTASSSIPSFTVNSSFWCAAKHYTRENCRYTFDDLRKTIPAAFKSIPTATINRFYHHCARTMDAYRNGLDYGTKAFVEHVHKNLVKS